MDKKPIKKHKGIVWEALSSVMDYLNPKEKRESVWMFILLIFTSLLDVFGLASLVPIIMAASKPGSIYNNKYSLWLYNSLEFEKEKSFLIFLILSLFVFFLIKNVITTIVNYQQVRFTAKLALKIIDNQFDKHNNLPFGIFNKIGSAHLIHHTVGTPQAFVSGIIRQLFILFSEIAIVVVIVAGVLLYQPILFVILAVVLVPSTILTYGTLRNRAMYIGERVDMLRPLSYRWLTDAFIGFVELRLANKQEQYKRRILTDQREIQDLDAKAYLYSLLPLKVIEMVAILAVTTIFLYSLLFSDKPEQLITVIGLFAAASYRLMPSVNRLISSLMAIKQHRFTIASLKEFHEYQTKQMPTQLPLVFKRDIVFDNLVFAFPDAEKPVLRNIEFKVAKGEKIGIIGSSGSGKTTLMNLLLRFYQEQSGHILVDGQPLTENNLAAWYQLVGYVKQDTFLMDASIRDNITLNDTIVDEVRLHYAVEQSSLQEFVNSLSDGLDTHIGERGSRLSGGQRQRIGIARALYKQTEVLIMDEATSALDNETEREVNEAIRRLATTDITIFIVAHRITTLRDCNRIIELRDGEVYTEHQYTDLINRTIATQQQADS